MPSCCILHDLPSRCAFSDDTTCIQICLITENLWCLRFCLFVELKTHHVHSLANMAHVGISYLSVLTMPSVSDCIPSDAEEMNRTNGYLGAGRLYGNCLAIVLGVFSMTIFIQQSIATIDCASLALFVVYWRPPNPGINPCQIFYFA